MAIPFSRGSSQPMDQTWISCITGRFFTFWDSREAHDRERESLSVMSDSLGPHGLYSPWNSPGQNTGIGSHSLLQGILPTQESNLGLLHCRQILYQQSHQGSLYVYKYLLIYMRRFIIGIGWHGYGAEKSHNLPFSTWKNQKNWWHNSVQVLRLRICKTGLGRWCDSEGPSLSPEVQEPGNPCPRTSEMSVSANTERAPWHFLRLSV